MISRAANDSRENVIWFVPERERDPHCLIVNWIFHPTIKPEHTVRINPAEQKQANPE